jgi:hypothetical protein
MASYVLEILDGDRAGEVIPVADRPLRIGRKPGNDIVLADEKTSGVHAEVVVEGDRHVLRDLGSTNGTFLDGKRVSEIVLTPGDVVTLGRLRVKFRAEGEAASSDPGELAVRRLDAGRVGRRGGSVGLLAALLVVGLGAGGWFWWQGRQRATAENPAQATAKAPLEVPGNKLALALASCETDDGWLRDPAGANFAAAGGAHTGSGALQARRDEGEAADFAVVRSKEPLAVFSGRTLTLAAHVRTEQGGQVAMRALLTAANEQVPFAFRTGTPMASHDGWTRLELVVAVPSTCDRVQVEFAALLPTSEAVARVDDVALVEAGTATAIEVKLEQTGQAAIGTGTAIAVRSTDQENPAIVLQVLPDDVGAPLQALHRAGLCVLSDVGGAIACTATERGFQIECQGTTALQFVLPGDAANGLLVGGSGATFTSSPADSEFAASSVLVGDRLTRAMLRLDGEKPCRGRSGGGRYRLGVPVAKLELQVSFREERVQAIELLARAKGAHEAGKPGEALDLVRDLTTRLPMDTEQQALANTLRNTILAAQAKVLRDLQKDLDDATFFATRGSFERIVLDVDQLVQLHGEHNLADAAAVTALRSAAQQRLAAIDADTKGPQRTRLTSLAKALAEAQQPALAQLVQRYIDDHLRQ